MSRRLRHSISVIVIILIAIAIYRWYDRQLTPVEPPSVLPPTDTQTTQTPPDQSSIGPLPSVQPSVPSTTPDGQHPYYIGISHGQYVAIYHWGDGQLVLYQETRLTVANLRQEEKEALTGYIGVGSEEEAWQKIEGFSH